MSSSFPAPSGSSSPAGFDHLVPFIGRVVINGSVQQVTDVKLNITNDSHVNFSWDSSNSSNIDLRASNSGYTGSRSITPNSIFTSGRVGVSKILYNGSTGQPYSLGGDFYTDALVNGHVSSGYGDNWQDKFRVSPYAGVTINGQTQGSGLNYVKWDDMTAYTGSPFYIYADASLTGYYEGTCSTFYNAIQNFPSQYYPTFNVGPNMAAKCGLNQGTYRFNDFYILQQPDGNDGGRAYFRYGPINVYGGGRMTPDITFNADGQFRVSSSSERNVTTNNELRPSSGVPYTQIGLGKPYTYYSGKLYGMNTFWTNTNTGWMGTGNTGNSQPFLVVTAIKSQWGIKRPTANFTINGPMEIASDNRSDPHIFQSNGSKSASTNDWRVYSQGANDSYDPYSQNWYYSRPECANWMYAAVPVHVTGNGTITINFDVDGVSPTGGSYTSQIGGYTYSDYPASRTITIS